MKIKSPIFRYTPHSLSTLGSAFRAKAQVRTSRLETIELCTSGLRTVFAAARSRPRALFPPVGEGVPFRLILSDTPFKKAVKVWLWKPTVEKPNIGWAHRIEYTKERFRSLLLTRETSLYLARRCAAITTEPKTFYIGVERA